jgi:hypothetical protein
MTERIAIPGTNIFEPLLFEAVMLTQVLFERVLLKPAMHPYKPQVVADVHVAQLVGQAVQLSPAPK